MKTKLLYVLVSSNNDVFLEQAHISVCSAKYHMPDCHIALLVDEKTDSLMDDNRRKVLKNVDEYVVIPLPDTTAFERSRLIKCNARNYVRGDFLYIDIDTIVVKPLYEIDNVKESIAAVNNCHLPFSDVSLRTWQEYEMGLCEKLGYPIKEEKSYFNGGVIFVKDDDVAHRFYDMWLNEYEQSRKKGIIKDQPSLMKTNYQMGHVIQHLDDIWNVQIAYGLKYMKDAKICHYFTSTKREGEQSFVLKQKDSFIPLKQDLDSISTDFYLQLIKDPFVGLSRYSRLITGNELLFMNTWLLNVFYYWYCDKRKLFDRIQSLIKAMVRLKKLFRFG